MKKKVLKALAHTFLVPVSILPFGIRQDKVGIGNLNLLSADQMT